MHIFYILISYTCIDNHSLDTTFFCLLFYILIAVFPINCQFFMREERFDYIGNLKQDPSF